MHSDEKRRLAPQGTKAKKMSEPTHVVIAGSARPVSPGAYVVAAADPEARLDITVKVRRKAPLPEVLPGVRISPEELTQGYGASEADLDLVASTLAGYGLKVEGKDPASRTVCLSGTVSAVESAFETRLFAFAGPRGDYRGRHGDLHIPTAIHDLVEGVFGLDDRSVVRPRRSVVIPEKATPAGGAFSSDLATAYSFPAGTGRGQTIALLEFGGGYFAADLKAYCRAAGVAVPKVNAISVSAPTNRKDGAEGEVMLDIEVVAAVLPQATINVYFAAFSEQGWVDVLDRVVKDAPDAVSISWGLAEDDPDWTASARAAIDDALQAAALVARAVASGDDGSGDQLEEGRAHVDFPSASSNVLAVGGTQATLSGGKLVGEAVWFDGDGKRSDNGGSGGGGVSVFTPRPTWQTVKVKSVNPHPIDGRVVPDLAAIAGAPYYRVVVEGQSQLVGGTSASAPLVASLILRMKANLPTGKALPFLTPLLYGGVGAAGCHDVAKGKNSTATVGGYKAGKGFDACTGWGSPNGTAMLAAVEKVL